MNKNKETVAIVGRLNEETCSLINLNPKPKPHSVFW